MRVRSVRRWYKSTNSRSLRCQYSFGSRAVTRFFRTASGAVKLTNDEPCARHSGTEFLAFLLVGYHAGYDDFEPRNGRVIRPHGLEIVAGEPTSGVRVDLAQVIQIDHGIRRVSCSKQLGHGSRQRRLTRARRPVQHEDFDPVHGSNVTTVSKARPPVFHDHHRSSPASIGLFSTETVGNGEPGRRSPGDGRGGGNYAPRRQQPVRALVLHSLRTCWCCSDRSGRFLRGAFLCGE